MGKNLLAGCMVEKVRYSGTRRGVSIGADLLMDGVKIGTINNDGLGGSTLEYIPDVYVRNEFVIRAKCYMTENGLEFPNESMLLETFLENLLDIHDFGYIVSDEEFSQMYKA